jgi:hypothetical protein
VADVALPITMSHGTLLFKRAVAYAGEHEPAKYDRSF